MDRFDVIDNVIDSVLSETTLTASEKQAGEDEALAKKVGIMSDKEQRKVFKKRQAQGAHDRDQGGGKAMGGRSDKEMIWKDTKEARLGQAAKGINKVYVKPAVDKTKEIAAATKKKAIEIKNTKSGDVTVGQAAAGAAVIGGAIGAWKLYKMWKAKRAAAKNPADRAKAEKMMKKAKAKATREAFGLELDHYNVFMEMADSLPAFLDFYTESLLTEDERYHIEQRIVNEGIEEDDAAIIALEAQIVAINNMYE